ncbi:hypothetical protein LR48_Vigan02g050900 [Vigna angularis]|uniref:PB1-like domain-containing protein n=1 Tax=Phaseolus angularis TaxID=3914 RepID=A0A0L9TVZ9_PHAAN|nr:hypothetical protein LR48_Vigan02g050900 [Vigna angularis]
MQCEVVQCEVLSGEDKDFIRAFELRDWSFDVNHEVVLRVREVVQVEFGGRGRYSPWGKFVNDGCLKYEGESDTMYFDPDLWSYFFLVSVVKSLGYDGFKDLWFSVGCGPVLNDRLEALCDDVGGDEVAPEVNEGGEGVRADGERIEVVVGQGEMTEADKVEGERIEVVEVDGEAERTEADEDEVKGERIEAERTEAYEDEVQGEKIEVEECHVEAERIEADEDEVQEVEECHVEAERIEAQDGEAYTIEVEDLEDIEVEVCDWSTSRDGDDGEMNSKDGLVNINVQCEFSESSGSMEVEVEPFLLGSESDMKEDEINDSSLFNDEWQSEDLTSPDTSDEESEDEEGEVGHNKKKTARRETKCRKRNNNPVHCLRVNHMEKNHFILEKCYMFYW